MGGGVGTEREAMRQVRRGCLQLRRQPAGEWVALQLLLLLLGGWLVAPGRIFSFFLRIINGWPAATPS